MWCSTPAMVNRGLTVPPASLGDSLRAEQEPLQPLPDEIRRELRLRPLPLRELPILVARPGISRTLISLACG